MTFSAVAMELCRNPVVTVTSNTFFGSAATALTASPMAPAQIANFLRRDVGFIMVCLVQTVLDRTNSIGNQAIRVFQGAAASFDLSHRLAFVSRRRLTSRPAGFCSPGRP